MLVTLTGSAQELIPQNMLRKSMVIQNVDSSITVFIKRERPGTTSVSASDFDLRLPPGGSVALNSFLDGKEAIEDRYTIIPASGTPQVAIFETEENKR